MTSQRALCAPLAVSLHHVNENTCFKICASCSSWWLIAAALRPPPARTQVRVCAALPGAQMAGGGGGGWLSRSQSGQDRAQENTARPAGDTRTGSWVAEVPKEWTGPIWGAQGCRRGPC